MGSPCVLTPWPPGCFHLTGELDISALSGIVDTLNQMRPSGDLELDLAGLTFMDSAGVLVLIYAAKLVEPTGRLLLVSPTRQVRRVLELSGIVTSMPNIEIVHSAELQQAGT